MKCKILGGLAAAAVIFASAGNAYADELTRPSCWTVLYKDYPGSKRVICFRASFHMTMTNTACVSKGSRACSDEGVDASNTSTCAFSGSYAQNGTKVTITVPEGSGKCSNGASSPRYSAECEFSGEALTCDGVTTYGGQESHLSFTAK